MGSFTPTNSSTMTGTRTAGGTTIGSGIITNLGTTAGTGSGISLQTQPASRNAEWYKVTSSYNPWTGESYTSGSFGPDWGIGQTGSFMYYNSPWTGTISTAEGGMTYVPGTIPAYTGAGSLWANLNYGPLTAYVNSVSNIGTSVTTGVFSTDLGIYSNPLAGGTYYSIYAGGYVPYTGGSYAPYYPVSNTIYGYPGVVSNYQSYSPVYYSPPTTSSTGNYPSIIY
ncbi:MAG: hypothetical protein AB1847_14155 [bacterium]